MDRMLPRTQKNNTDNMAANMLHCYGPSVRGPVYTQDRQGVKISNRDTFYSILLCISFGEVFDLQTTRYYTVFY